MMKMDGRNSAECQNWEKMDITGINGIVLSRKRQKRNSDCLLHIEMRTKNGKREKKSGSGCAGAIF